MATNIFSLKTKDSANLIYTDMLEKHVSDNFLDVCFVTANPPDGQKAECYKTLLGYALRDAGLYFESKGTSIENKVKINKVVVDFAVCSKKGFIDTPLYTYNTADMGNWNATHDVIRKQQVGNHYTTYFRVTLEDSTPDDCTSFSIRFETIGVFVYDAYVEYKGDDFVTVSPSTLSFVKDGSSETINISSNASWTISTDQNWLSVHPTSGSNNGTVTVTVPVNETSKERVGNIKIKSPNVHETSVKVTQTAGDKELSVSPASVEIDHNPQNKIFTIISNVNWKVTPNSTWLAVNPATGSDNGQITVTAEHNYVETQRTGTLTISSLDNQISKTITVEQSAYTGPKLIVSPKTMSIGAAGGTKNVDVSSNKDWTVINEYDWVSVNPTSGSRVQTISVNVSKNNTTSPRPATISIKTTDNQNTSTFTVNQSAAAAYITPNPTSLSFPQNNSSNTLTIDSNVSWEISRDVEWCTLDKITGGQGTETVTVSVTDNDTQSQRTGSLTISGSGVTKTVAISQES